MTDREQARCRAQGALDNFIENMREEIKNKNENYQEEFLDALLFAMYDYSTHN